MTEISPVKFYSRQGQARTIGPPSKGEQGFHQKLRTVEEGAAIYKERPLVHFPRKSSFASYNIWETFPTQNQATEFCFQYRSKINKKVRIFSQELSTDGKRMFLVTTGEEFWEKYSKLPSKKKNFYEMIEDGRPCRLYFDLEFYKDVNPGLDGVDILEIFIDVICFYLQEMFSISCGRGSIVDLDSSTNVKFSRHLIFHLPNAIFYNNIVCGNFVKYVYEMIRRAVSNKDGRLGCELKSMNVVEKEVLPPTNLEIGKLFVSNKDGKKTFFCDLGVYSRNRNFRLYGATKIEKNSNLVISDQNGFHGSSQKSQKHNKTFSDPEFSFFLDTLVCPLKTIVDDCNILIFGDVETVSTRGNIDFKTGMQGKIEDGHRQSPFPTLDAFILKQINRGGVQGVIRRWMHFVSSNLMIYDIDKNRWCMNIGRSHKSNHIYLVVDMKCGVFYQKCHDPDCHDFKSEEMTLPVDVNPCMNDSEYLIDDFEDSSQILADAVDIAECEDSFLQNESNEVAMSLMLDDEKVFAGNEINNHSNIHSESSLALDAMNIENDGILVDLDGLDSFSKVSHLLVPEIESFLGEGQVSYVPKSSAYTNNDKRGTLSCLECRGRNNDDKKLALPCLHCKETIMPHFFQGEKALGNCLKPDSSIKTANNEQGTCICCDVCTSRNKESNYFHSETTGDEIFMDLSFSPSVCSKDTLNLKSSKKNKKEIWKNVGKDGACLSREEMDSIEDLKVASTPIALKGMSLLDADKGPDISEICLDDGLDEELLKL